MRQLRLASSILAALSAALTVTIAQAQSGSDQVGVSTNADQTENKKEEKLQTITVTGSLIPQSQIETASPVITISTQQMERQGFGTVYDALRAQPVATGGVQDAQVAAFGGFTAGANTISLLGLDPGFTLFLINGHPLADYPLLYNGQSNFVDPSNIPVGLVDHIDILPGNQSSIYGSSAIAGVINIILKAKIDGYELNIRGGGFSGGGGNNQRVEFLGGQTWGDLTATFGIQFNNQRPIFASDRASGSTLSNPIRSCATVCASSCTIRTACPIFPIRDIPIPAVLRVRQLPGSFMAPQITKIAREVAITAAARIRTANIRC